MDGRGLKVARAKLGISQKELADALGLTQVTISRYETSDDHLPKIVEIAVNCLVKEAESEQRVTTRED